VIATSTSHPLDNPVWSALTTSQASFAEAADFARRFPAEITTLAGFSSPTVAGYDSLASLTNAGEVAAVFLESSPTPTTCWKIIEDVPLLQMVHERNVTIRSAIVVDELITADVPQMLALADLTNPGPFGTRTRELGDYLGVRREGRIVAMAGERMRVPGYGEISAVCTHPEHSGHGYASALVAELVLRIRDRGDVPFLHVRPANKRAVQLYDRLGFKGRVTFQLAVLRKEL
jgi:ribosomal protein S18 acetylase RimI-like enzyme